MRLTNFKLIIVLLIFQLFVISTLSQADDQSSPHLFSDFYRFDFGNVEESSILKHTFKLSNHGKTTLILKGAQSTCGCTVPKLTVTKLNPGESTDLLVTIDTAMKQGRITKTVTILSNDPSSPLKLYLSMFVTNPHKDLTDESKAKIFTSDKCNSCHVARGVGLFGQDLFEADCAMCHGKLGLGAVGPQLLGPYENKDFLVAMEKVTSYGSPTHRSMPGFLVDAGGPLSQKQIHSLMQYLGTVSKKRYYPGKVMPTAKQNSKK